MPPPLLNIFPIPPERRGKNEKGGGPPTTPGDKKVSFWHALEEIGRMGPTMCVCGERPLFLTVHSKNGAPPLIVGRKEFEVPCFILEIELVGQIL